MPCYNIVTPREREKRCSPLRSSSPPGLPASTLTALLITKSSLTFASTRFRSLLSTSRTSTVSPARLTFSSIAAASVLAASPTKKRALPLKGLFFLCLGIPRILTAQPPSAGENYSTHVTALQDFSCTFFRAILSNDRGAMSTLTRVFHTVLHKMWRGQKVFHKMWKQCGKSPGRGRGGFSSQALL